MATEFKLRIELGDDAMQTAEDIAKALRGVAGKVSLDDHGYIFDENGNKVGTWECDAVVEDEDEDEDNGCDECGATDFRNCTCDEDDELEPDTDSLEDRGIELGSYES